MWSKVLSRAARSKPVKDTWTSQRRTAVELSTRKDEGQQLESSDPTKSRYSLLNENSLSRRVLAYSKFKTEKSLESVSHGDREFETIKIKHRNWVLFDEQNEFVSSLIDRLSDELNVDREAAKRLFFSLNSLTGAEMANLLGRAGGLERNFRAVKQYATRDQLINNDFELLKNFRRSLFNRINILKLVGIQITSTYNQLNFPLIIGQTEETLKQLNLLEKNSNLVDRILSQLNLSDGDRQRAKRICGPTDGLTLFEVLDRLSGAYLQIRLNYAYKQQHKKFFRFNQLDLLNVDRVLDFIDSLKVRNDKPREIRKHQMKEIFRLNAYELAEIDVFLQENDLQFVWRHLFDEPHLFGYPDMLMGKLKRLLDAGVSREQLAKNFLLFYHNVVRLEFFLDKFGSSFFDYPRPRTAFFKYNSIVQKSSEVGDQQLKSYTFTEFMREHI